MGVRGDGTRECKQSKCLFFRPLHYTVCIQTMRISVLQSNQKASPRAGLRYVYTMPAAVDENAVNGTFVARYRQDNLFRCHMQMFIEARNDNRKGSGTSA